MGIRTKWQTVVLLVMRWSMCNKGRHWRCIFCTVRDCILVSCSKKNETCVHVEIHVGCPPDWGANDSLKSKSFSAPLCFYLLHLHNSPSLSSCIHPPFSLYSVSFYHWLIHAVKSSCVLYPKISRPLPFPQSLSFSLSLTFPFCLCPVIHQDGVLLFILTLLCCALSLLHHARMSHIIKNAAA